MTMCEENDVLESGTVRVKLTRRQKANLSPDAQALVEAGFYTPELELSSRKHFIKFLLLPKFEKEYAELARKELAELDRENEAEEVKAKKKG